MRGQFTTTPKRRVLISIRARMKKQKPYKLSANLPFFQSENDYSSAYDTLMDLMDSDDVSQDLKGYLQIKHAIRSKWAKFEMKKGLYLWEWNIISH